jgi:MoaA/NifB/PqqE/SkfB family radical SAM enzyme
MSFDIFKKGIDESVALGVNKISLCGYGEPLMDNELEQKLQYIKTNYPNTKVGMTTTGYNMEGKILDLLCKYVDILRISNYGITKESYERVHRGKLKYEKIKDNIANLLGKQKRPKTVLVFLDLLENQGDMKQWIEYYEPITDRIDVWKVSNWGGGGYLGCKDVLFREL